MHALDEAWDSIKREFDLACGQVARAARCQVTNELNQLLRRFRHYETEADWMSALLDGASRFAGQVAIFSLQNDTFRLRAQAKLDLPGDLSFPLSSAPAFASSVQTHDPIVALRTASEVTQHLAGSEAGERAHIIPIMNRTRAVAILFVADREYMDVNALELLAGLASTVLERQANTTLHSQIEPALAKAAPSELRLPSEQTPANVPKADRATLPTWAELSQEQRMLHMRAQRFSRVTVAEMQLGNPDACRAGREQNDIYLFLKLEIEKARESYRKQFMTIPSMVDYLHLELVNTAAEGDEMKLGAEYPGQLV